jgi:Ion channel
MSTGQIIAAIGGVAIVLVILWDVFETIILPRRVTRRFRLARLFYRSTSKPWLALGRRIHNANRRESFLGFFGPLSLLGLFAVWAAGLIFAFALLHDSIGSQLSVVGEKAGFWTDLYMSGTTFFTLGLGDVTPRTEWARVVTVAEAGIGFGFLALVISYLPVLYGAFSQREVNISLLDARAGSPPTAGELLARHMQPHSMEALERLLREWEIWSAQLMESHLSYPVLCYFRSQHNNQSWLSALSTILDASALLIAYGCGSLRGQAKLTFAISRHAIADLAQVLNCPPVAPRHDRLPDAELQRLRALLVDAKISACTHEEDKRLVELRQMYEPYINALSDRLLMPVSAWTAEQHRADNWRTSAWARISGERGRAHGHSRSSSAGSVADEEEHF